MKNPGYTIVPSYVMLKRTFSALRNPLPVFYKNVADYGNPYAAKILNNRLAIFTSKPSIIQHVLQKNHRGYEKSDIQTKEVANFLGKGLLTLEGKEWLRQRRLIQPGFHKEKIEGIRSIMEETIDDYLVLLNTNSNGKTVNIHEEMMSLAFYVVSNSLLGTKISEREIHVMRHGVDIAQNLLVKLIRLPFLAWYFKANGSYKHAMNAVGQAQDMVMSFVQKRKTEGRAHNDLLDMLIHSKYEDTGETMTDKQLLFELMVMFVAGHETSANALTWTLYLLARNKNILEKLRLEIDNNDFRYLRQVIQESLRIYPPAWITDRVALEDDEVDGVHIPKGAMVINLIYAVQHDATYWPNPEKFDPDRFHQDKQIEPYTYLPFGGGPRLCIGMQFAMMEMELALKEFVKRFDFELADNRPVELNPLITLNPKGAVNLKIQARG